MLIDIGLGTDNLANEEYGAAVLTLIPGVGGEAINRGYKGLKVTNTQKAHQIGATSGILTGQTINQAKSNEKSTSKKSNPEFFVIEMPTRAQKFRNWKRGRDR
ncbi:hypothetical protein [Pseudoalteromonas piscicida]|uniref:hypothetical protein n=1 Tax=Pseudoalteromonas piscicida TaxID=43662 RepID=UPI000C165A05|nr:hypothetical protein [Pseudoalteromonas piscicida]